MPPRPRAPRARVSTLRRPRVAGLAPAGQRHDGPQPIGNGAAIQPDGGADLQRAPTRLPDSPPVRPDADTWPVDAVTAAGPTTDVAEAWPVDGVTAAGPTADVAEADGAPGRGRTGDVDAGGAATTDVSTSEGPTAVVLKAGPAPVGVRPATGPAAGMVSLRAGRRSPVVPLLAAALVLLTGLAVTFGILDAQVRGTPSANNTALIDVGATAEAAGQLSDALETVYSYDFARLDQNEGAAREVITPAFAAEFDALFGQVRELAPQQQAVVTATVTVAAVRSVEGDRAVLVAFMDQQATRAAVDGKATQLAAAARITVTGERVDGRWKIAGVESR